MNKATTAQVAKMESWGWSTEAIEAWVVRDAAERNLRKVARKAGVNVTGQPSTLIVRDNVDATVTEAARTLAQAEINFQSTQG